MNFAVKSREFHVNMRRSGESHVDIAVKSRDFCVNSRRFSGILGAGLFTRQATSTGSSARQVTPDGQIIAGYSQKPAGEYVSTVPCCWRKNDAGE